MPYTPPATRSPAQSQQTSPVATPGRPQLPRSNSSTSYLSKHRPGTSLPEYQPYHADPTITGHEANSTSIRQSPPPVTDQVMPAGAIISPPDSPADTSQDNSPQDAQTSTRLRELQDAVRRSFSPTKRTGSPQNEPADTERKSKFHIDLPIREAHNQEDNELSTPGETLPPTPPPRLSASARKISHSRSATDSSILDGPSTGASLAPSDDSEEDFADGKPPLLRKKSGELVKPAIRPNARRKHSSMPGTPTYSKAVHFGEEIEQVRHFLQVDRPIAVSAGASPVDGHEEETEFPFGLQTSRGPEWELRPANFPRDSLERMSKLVRVERLLLSPDQKSLVGAVAVANISFHKQVTARFTLDYWRTTSEVVAEYSNDTRSPRNDGYDLFNFSIKLSDQANLELRTLLLCVKYTVAGQEHWDNNDSMNYQVEFAKKEKKPVRDTNGPKTAPVAPISHSIPRSRHNSSSFRADRPVSMSSLEDDFSRGDTAIKFRNNALGNNLTAQNANGGTQFSTRYDFGASLTAALSQAQAELGTRNGVNGLPVRSTRRPQVSSELPPQPPPTGLPPRTGVVPPANTQTATPAVALADKQSMDSKAYEDFINKFCFFEGGQKGANSRSSSSKDAPSGNDGAQDEASAKTTPPARSVDAAVRNATLDSNCSPEEDMSSRSSGYSTPASYYGINGYGNSWGPAAHAGWSTPPTAIQG